MQFRTSWSLLSADQRTEPGLARLSADGCPHVLLLLPSWLRTDCRGELSVIFAFQTFLQLYAQTDF